MKWIVWLCCNQFDIYDTKAEAFQEAHWQGNGDNAHQPYAIEGPGGVDLTEEFKRYSHEASKRESEAYQSRVKEAEQTLLGSVDVKSPSGAWYSERVYNETYRNEILATYREAFGDSRVRFVPVRP